MNDSSLKIRNLWKKGFDSSVLLGIAIAIVLFLVAIVTGGGLSVFINIPSLLLVMGCTVAITVASTSFKGVKDAFVSSLLLFSGSPQKDPHTLALQMIDISKHVRKSGVISLKLHLNHFEKNPMLHRALTLVSEGYREEDIRSILQRDANNHNNSLSTALTALQKMADYAPAMGLIGTLIGLVKMLGSISDPSSIGPNMAVALLTTFYGAVLSNLLFLPLSSKLQRQQQNNVLINEIIVGSCLSISSQENTYRLGIWLNTVLPLSQRIQVYS